MTDSPPPALPHGSGTTWTMSRNWSAYHMENAMSQSPSIGRIVHFHEEGGPYPAIITALNDDGSIELATFGRNSVYFQHNVREVEVTSTEKGRWSWPPRT